MLQAFLSALLIGVLITLASALGSSSKLLAICGGTSSSKNIRLQTPSNPPRECVYHINAYSSYVCQLRIDFAMTLAQPTLPTAESGLKNAQCLDDYFNVLGFRLCGNETQQHIYLPFNRTAGVTKIDLKIVLAARVGWKSLPPPSWDMHVTQLECPAGAAIRSSRDVIEATSLRPEARATIKDGFFVAPPGCLQYFPQSVGAFTSFNFNNGRGVYPGDLNYAICFRRTPQARGLELSSHFFKLGAVAELKNRLVFDELCYPQKRSEGVGEDYLMIPQGIVKSTGMRATYFCGDSTTETIIQSVHPGPMMLVFNSGGADTAAESGFAFSYKMLV